MTIDWMSLLVVALVTVVAAVIVVGIYSLGLASLATHRNEVADGRPATAALIGGYACLGVAGLVVLYGLYLIVPQFH